MEQAKEELSKEPDMNQFKRNREKFSKENAKKDFNDNLQ